MLSREALIASLRQLLPELSDRFGVESLHLFGSFSRDEQREDSDIDLVAEFSRPPTLLTLAAARLFLCDKLEREVDFGTLSSLRPAIRERAEREWLRVA
jgi:predicted nucleotidyltransferase